MDSAAESPMLPIETKLNPNASRSSTGIFDPAVEKQYEGSDKNVMIKKLIDKAFKRRRYKLMPMPKLARSCVPVPHTGACPDANIAYLRCFMASATDGTNQGVSRKLSPRPSSFSATNRSFSVVFAFLNMLLSPCISAASDSCRLRSSNCASACSNSSSARLNESFPVARLLDNLLALRLATVT